MDSDNFVATSYPNPVTNESLEQELFRVVEHLDWRLKRLSVAAQETGCHVMDLQDRMGRYLADDILIAKATALAGISNLRK